MSVGERGTVDDLDVAEAHTRPRAVDEQVRAAERIVDMIDRCAAQPSS